MPRFFLFAALLLLPSGCNVIGGLTYKLAGPPEVAAKFTLAKRPTLVLVENYRSPGVAIADMELIASLVATKLNEKGVVPIVPAEKLFDVRSAKPTEFRKMLIPDIGKACGAEQVIYVDYQGGGVSPVGTAAYQGKAASMVRVVDVATGQTLWPTDAAEGYSVGYQTKMISAEHRPEQIRSELFDGLAVNISRLFHKWKPDDLDDHDND